MAVVIPYIVGSASFAYLSSSLYSYMFTEIEPQITKEETKEESIEVSPEESIEVLEKIHIEESIEISPEESKEDLEEIHIEKSNHTLVEYFLYKCSICTKEYPLDSFSKNQRKKNKSLWKCISCAKKLD
jgi:DNA-directed RNA polymerase subunit RPC12/RpoP